MSNEWQFKEGVSEEEFRQAKTDLIEAIEKIDSPEEWLDLTKKIVLTVGKIAISHLPVGGIAIDILEEVFGEHEDIMNIVKRIIEEKTNE